MNIPELKLSEKAVKLPQCLPHALVVEVEVSQRLVTCDVAHLLQTACQVFGQWPHCHALNLSVHDDGACCQALDIAPM